MNASAFAALILTALATSCDAGPQQRKGTDKRHAAPAPGVKVIRPDSPAGTRMPVMRTDSARQERMPVVIPPGNVQPK